MQLLLPRRPIPDRVSIAHGLKPDERHTYATLEGPGCIRHLWVVLAHPRHIAMANRKAILRIYFDGEPIPAVESPVGDLFGVMHGQCYYPVDNHFLSVKALNGYNCYFPMPFAASARIEVEAGPEGNQVYLQVDWHRYPGEELQEPRRFCARWRRESPAERYGHDYLLLDADGPGDLLGFVYGVRLLDDTDRWSHGGAENVYIDGETEHPSYLRGIGGEDTFGAGYGGALHPPESHHYAALPYYTHEDVSESRPAQRVVGYRFFEHDTLPFEKSIHVRFGCMANDICSTVYWYQNLPVRPFVTMPDWPDLLPEGKNGDPIKLAPGVCDLPLPESGEWWLCGPFGNREGRALQNTLLPEKEMNVTATYEGMHEPGSAWLTEGSRQLGRDRARWIRYKPIHGFVDFNHVFRPWARGVGKTEVGVAVARCVLPVKSDTTAVIRLSWDDHLIARLAGGVFDLGHNRAFRTKEVEVSLKAGANPVALKLSNDRGSNHGGWAFAFSARAKDGTVLFPQAE